MAQEERVELILDASGSMNQRLPEGQSRFDAARAAIATTVAGIAPATLLALRVYGHQSTPDQHNCEDTALVLPFAPAGQQAASVGSQLSGLQALGYTPITLSLQKAAEDFPKDVEAASTVILVSDGKETCKSDPCAAARALAEANVKLVVHTVGFGVDQAARQQLQCIASVARGQYYDAGSLAELTAKLGQATKAKAAPPPAPPAKQAAATGILTVKGIKEAGVPVTNSSTGEDAGVVGTVGDNRLELAPGIYGIKFLNGTWTGVEIKAGETTEIVPAYLKVENPANTNFALVDPETQEEVASFFQNAIPEVALLPGHYLLRNVEGMPFGEIDLIAGQTTSVTPGIIRIVSSSNHLYRIDAGDGVSGNTPAGNDVSLPAGHYSIADTDNAEATADVDLKAGEVKEVTMP